MLKYLYNYEVITTFTNEVARHALMLRCLPDRNAFQHVDEEHVVFSPLFRMHRGTDAFGNRTLYGEASDPHSRLAYVSTGIVSQVEYYIPDPYPQPYYLVASKLTFASEEMLAELATVERKTSLYEQALAICHRVNAVLEYTPGQTVIGTTAAEAFKQRKGVCQDFAHVMIALCRQMHIRARYVNGFIIGEGKTHAWVEVHDGYAWRAIDPTHDTFVCSGYIKLSHGRDALDCTVDRGTFVGVTRQETTIRVNVSEL